MWDGPRRTADLDSEPEAPEGTVERWLRDLEEHLHSGSADLQRLFEPSGLWKDLFALDSQPLLLTVGAAGGAPTRRPPPPQLAGQRNPHGAAPRRSGRNRADRGVR